jgi:DNA-binding NarL/FixJ family response regulator
MIRVMLAEDHDILRDGLKTMLVENVGIRIVGEAANGKELIEFLELTPVDVVLMDINMPVMDGFEATSYLREHYPHIGVLVLSMIEQQHYVQRILNAGAKGYILKNSSRQELIEAIYDVAKGNQVIGKGIDLNSTYEIPDERRFQKMPNLSEREMQVLTFIAEGLTNTEIAGKLCLSKRTIESHRKNLLEKTNCKNSSALIKYAIYKGLLKDVRID